MSIVLMGSTSGSCTLQEQAVAGTSVLTLPVGTGTVVANNVNSAIVSGTVNAGGANPFNNTLSFIDFTGLPNWIRRITVLFNGVSTNGTSNIQIQVGISTGVVTTGYTSGIGYRNGEAASTTGFVVGQMASAGVSFSGVATINTFGSNIWTSGGTMSRNDGWAVMSGGFVTAIGGTLDRIRITTVNGTDTFDAGSINILYE